MSMKTPLYETHKNLNAKMVDFGGWEMPLQYASIIDEHINTREKAGLFDVSHMGEITVKGSSAKEILNELITNDLNLLQAKKIAYSFLTNEKGGVVDDLLVYKISGDEFLLVVNASNTDKDYQWLIEKTSDMPGDFEILNRSHEYGQLAIQGPSAQVILQKLTGFNLDNITFFTFDSIIVCGKENVIVSRTGYTGEDGFEIYCDQSYTVEIWENILAAGVDEGIKPVGLGARDTLRFESALPLYGHELNEDITPVEAGLKMFVNLGKEKFLGKNILEEQINGGVQRKLTGIELIGRGIPRDGYRVEKDGKDVGYITSGTYSPTFKKGLAMAMLPANIVQPDNEVDVVIRDNKVKAKLVTLPFYKKKRN